MATEKKTEAEAPAKAKAKLEDVIEQAEALLHPPTAAYVEADEHFDRGVKAVLDLLRK
jgi:hypothetical protein